MKYYPYLCFVINKTKNKMKISQYNWSWWFVLTIIVLTIGLMVGMVAKTTTETIVANIIMVVGLVSLIPCLYIGCKPSEN